MVDCTMNFVSNAFFVVPCNPPDVQLFFHNLGDKWWDMAAFLGYAKNDLEGAVTESDRTYQQQIAFFLNMFEMPECGTRSVPILHKAAQKAGISSGAPRKKQSLYTLGLTGKSFTQTVNYTIIYLIIFSLCTHISPCPSLLLLHMAETPDLSSMKTGGYAKGMPSLELHEPQPKSKFATAHISEKVSLLTVVYCHTLNFLFYYSPLLPEMKQQELYQVFPSGSLLHLLGYRHNLCLQSKHSVHISNLHMHNGPSILLSNIILNMQDARRTNNIHKLYCSHLRGIE